MNKIIYILTLFTLFSCQQEVVKKPTNFIDKNKMVDLIVDMKIAEKAKNIQNKDKKKNKNYMSFVFDKYQIDSVQFKENNDYYTNNIELYQEIYETVSTRLKDSVTKYKKIKKVNDSLAKIKKKEKLLLIKDKFKKPAKIKKKKKRPVMSVNSKK
ncbi:MAG TPA: DUF4296 domain-containing protein [Flavobacteriaceae bacterium]|nr:DUF4296 domain-containing protein [Flavobacteriaceae bacterium]